MRSPRATRHLEEGFNFLGSTCAATGAGPAAGQAVDHTEPGCGQANPAQARRRDAPHARLERDGAHRQAQPDHPGLGRLLPRGGVQQAIRRAGSLLVVAYLPVGVPQPPAKTEERGSCTATSAGSTGSGNDRWVFGARGHLRGDRGEIIAHLIKFSWTKIVRHPLVAGGASPDDPDLDRLLGRAAAKGRYPRWTATTCACSPSRTGAARCAGTASSRPTSHRDSPHAWERWWLGMIRTGDRRRTTSPTTGEAARRTGTGPALYTPPATAACGLADAGATGTRNALAACLSRVRGNPLARF